MEKSPIIAIDKLIKRFPIGKGEFTALNGIDLSDIVFNTDFRCDNLYQVCFPYAVTDVYTGAVILSKHVADTDEEYPAVFIIPEKFG